MAKGKMRVATGVRPQPGLKEAAASQLFTLVVSGTYCGSHHGQRSRVCTPLAMWLLVTHSGAGSGPGSGLPKWIAKVTRSRSGVNVAAGRSCRG